MAAALNHLPEAEQLLSAWLAAPSALQWVPNTKVKLASVLILEGKFGPGAAIYNDLLKLPLPEAARKGLQNAATLFGAFADLPAMQIKVASGSQPLHWDKQDTPRTVVQADKGSPVEVLLDTGANLSTVSHSAAQALGLQVLNTPVQTQDSVGHVVAARLALAPHLRMGTVELRNVPFLVLEDQDRHFKDYSMDMILGLPVMLQLGRLELYRNGRLVIGPSPAKADAYLFLDQFNLAVRTNLGATPIDLMMDTGARRSHLGSDFHAQVGSAWNSYKPTSAKDSSGGVGGIVETQATRLQNPDLKLAGQTLNWKEIFSTRSRLPKAA